MFCTAGGVYGNQINATKKSYNTVRDSFRINIRMEKDVVLKQIVKEIIECVIDDLTDRNIEDKI